MITIKSKGLDQAIRILNELPGKLEEQADEFVGKVGEYGAKRAEMYFYIAPYAGDREDIRVFTESNGQEHRVTVTAFGAEVHFIEFGTGVTMPDSPEAREDIIGGSVLSHGQYGEGRGANPNGWVFPYENVTDKYSLPLGTHPIRFVDKKTGRTKMLWKTRGNPAYPAMYMSKIDISEEAETIAREVFSNDR